MTDERGTSMSSGGIQAQFPAISMHCGEATLSFVHAWPPTFNIGDYLSSPRHYFDFKCHSPSESGFSRILILGGGAFNDFGAYASSLVESDRKVAWGVGQSIQPLNGFGELSSSISTDFSFFGSRDRALAVSNSTLVPCASVMGDIVDILPGTALGVFLNRNPAASGQAVFDVLSAIEPNVIVGTNSMSEPEFRSKFALTGKIITNSYHVAYWGLLSGRQVALIGYSSKFTSLFDLLQLPADVTLYQRGDAAGLSGAIKRVLDGELFSCLPLSTETKLAFRQTNISYAERLVAAGLFREIRPLDQSNIHLRRRELEVWRAYSLARR
ncbi:MAG: hypothetical protein EOS17_28005 [Mesorhizobium sp.]|nr:MAG: hypothetical protein EOS17_28005 [Mesorhizobium sp.]